MLTIAHNRYRRALEYTHFLEGYSLANAGLSRLRFKIGRSDFTNETFNFPDAATPIGIVIDQVNNHATITVQPQRVRVILDVAYQGALLTSYTIRKD